MKKRHKQKAPSVGDAEVGNSPLSLEGTVERLEDGACSQRKNKPPHRGGGFGSSCKAKQSISIGFANITSGSDAVVGWLRYECKRFDIVCLAEIHHRAKKLQAFAKDIASDRTVIATEAEASGRSDRGTTAGVAILPRPSLDVTLPNGSTSRFGCWSSPEDSAGLVGMQLNLREGQSLQLYSSYHVDEPSTEILATIHRRTRGGTLPFMMCGDFNMDRKIFVDKHQTWLEGLKAEVVGCNEATCSLGQRLELDFVIVSTCFAPSVSVGKPDWAVPFGPHACLDIQVARFPCMTDSWTLRLPKALPLFDQEVALSQVGRTEWVGALAEAKGQLLEEQWPDELDRSLAVTYRAAEMQGRCFWPKGNESCCDFQAGSQQAIEKAQLEAMAESSARSALCPQRDG